MEKRISDFFASKASNKKSDPARDLCFQIIATAVEDLVLAEFYITKLGLGNRLLAEITGASQFSGISKLKTVNDIKSDLKIFFTEDDTIFSLISDENIDGEIIYNTVLDNFKKDWCNSIHNTLDFYTWKDRAKAFGRADLIEEYLSWKKRNEAEELIRRKEKERLVSMSMYA